MKKKWKWRGSVGVLVGGFVLVGGVLAAVYPNTEPLSFVRVEPPPPPYPLPLNKSVYDRKMLFLAHYPTELEIARAAAASTTPDAISNALIASSTNTATTATLPSRAWPPKTVYPQGEAILPSHRVVAYYRNFYSTAMGALEQYPPEEMIPRLLAAAAEWRAADPETPVIPAIHYIAMVAQAGAGADGKYRAGMPDDQIEKALELADEIHGLVFLDLQVGLSDLQTELPLYEKYLALPNVHLAIDPEFAMKTSGAKPGTVIGTYDAADINYAAQYLASVVREHRLTPKILVVHRFTEDMVTNYKNITPLPEVQIVMDMDGWGDKEKKIGTYTHVIAAEPVQFTGFKLFYKNDLKPPSTGLLTPTQVLDLTPSPIYIQYQ